jgi:hypothetical protein
VLPCEQQRSCARATLCLQIGLLQRSACYMSMTMLMTDFGALLQACMHCDKQRERGACNAHTRRSLQPTSNAVGACSRAGMPSTCHVDVYAACTMPRLRMAAQQKSKGVAARCRGAGLPMTLPLDREVVCGL